MRQMPLGPGRALAGIPKLFLPVAQPSAWHWHHWPLGSWPALLKPGMSQNSSHWEGENVPEWRQPRGESMHTGGDGRGCDEVGSLG